MFKKPKKNCPKDPDIFSQSQRFFPNPKISLPPLFLPIRRLAFPPSSYQSEEYSTILVYSKFTPLF